MPELSPTKSLTQRLNFSALELSPPPARLKTVILSKERA
jgi:hypothetical protein